MTLSLLLLKFTFQLFLELSLCSTVKVLVELLAEVGISLLGILLVLIGKNHICVKEVIGTDFIHIEKESGAAVVGYSQNDISISQAVQILLENLAGLAAVNDLAIHALSSLDCLCHCIIRHHIATGHAT